MSVDAARRERSAEGPVKAHAVPPERSVGLGRWIFITKIAVGVGVIVAVLALFLEWDVWPGFVAAVLVTAAISTSLTVYVDAATLRAAREESERLRELILARLPLEEDDPHREAHDEFVSRRFAKNFAKYAGQAPRYGGAFNLLSLGSIVAALASSGLAASADASTNAGDGRWVVFGLGLVVAGFTALNQLWRPAQRSTSCYRAANSLRQEGWDFVLARGRYDATSPDTSNDDLPQPEPPGIGRRIIGSFSQPADPSETSPRPPISRRKADVAAVNLFVDEVAKILRDSEAIDETAPELAASNSP